VTDYFSVREELGGAEALRALVEAAHARNLRVLLDLPLNHTSIEHPYFQQAARLGRRSHYYGFYDRDGAGEPTHYFDWTHLPNLDYGNAEVQQWVLAFSTYWLAQLDVDGYRVDAAWGVKQRNPDFYPRWRTELKRAKPDVLLLAEASARDPYYLGHGYDAAYDWTTELGHHAWEKVFESPHGIAARLRDAIEETRAGAARPERTLRFLNNNDTGDRFITRHGEPLTQVATAALLTLPGIPCLYAFDEVGFGFRPYDEQVPEQPERPALRTLHKALIALRKRTPALRGPGYQVIAQRGELLAYARRGVHPGEVAIVALNFGATPAVEALTLPGDALAAKTALRDAQSGRPEPVRAGKVALSLPPYGFRILVSARGAR
jgi:cyclomaltodextrinase / maltogenic alpha-amylase / neopullulanase